MAYNYNFALGSVLFMGLTAAFYLRQRRMRDLQDHLFTLMLFGGLAAVFFDFLAAALEPSALSLPQWLLYTINTLFIIGEQLCLPAFFIYSLTATGRYARMGWTARTLTLLPFMLILCLLIISPLGQSGIFYIDEAHIYRPGATHKALYVVAGLYMISSCVLLLFNFHNIDRVKRRLIPLVVGLILCAMLVQIFRPQLLLATAATALALTTMYYLMRSPGEQIDPFTLAYCRPMLPAVLQDLREKKQSCTLLLYSLLNLDEIVRIQGPEFSDSLLTALSAYLRSTFDDDAVIYMNDSEFTVVAGGGLDADALAAFRQQAPVSLSVDGFDVPVKLAMAALDHHWDYPMEKTLTAMDFLFRQMAQSQRADLIIADAAFRAKCERLTQLESSIEQILQEGTPRLITRPVRDAASEAGAPPAILDVSLSLSHELLEQIAPEELLVFIRQSGNLLWYYEKLISLTGEKAAETDPDIRFCLPLFSAVLIQDDMAPKLYKLVTAAGMDPGRVLLRLLEKDISGVLPVVADNIRRLADCGFRLRLDGFAEGFTDVSLLSALPIHSVMIDRSLLKHAKTNERSQALLGCVVQILLETGKEVICAGVDADADADAARAAGARLIHGQWCATL